MFQVKPKMCWLVFILFLWVSKYKLCCPHAPWALGLFSFLGGGADCHQQCDLPTPLLSLRLPLLQRDQLCCNLSA